MKKNLIFKNISLVLFTTVILGGCTDDKIISPDNKQLSNSTQNLSAQINIGSGETERSNEIHSGFARDFGIFSSDNPIDKAFKKDFEIGSFTPELNYLAHSYCDAWEKEWDNIIDKIMDQYQFDEDKKKVQDYKKSYGDFITNASDLEWIDWSDTSVEPGKNRTFGTGAISASVMEEAVLYKRQVLYLIDKYFSSNYSYLYNGNGAELEKLRKDVSNK